MPITNIKEIGFEAFIEQELVEKNGYIVRTASQYDKVFAMDPELVVQFLRTTQPEAWRRLEEQYEAETPSRVLARIDAEITSRGLLEVVRKGVMDRGVHIELVAFKPETALNAEALAQYQQNIFSVMRQVKYSEKNENSIDVVLFLNGLPLFTVELKNQLTGQTVKHAIAQYRNDRDPKEKLLSFQRCFTHFAVDTEEVFMCTKLEGLRSFFLPFNKGNNGGAGNPSVQGAYKTHYLWEEIWAKDAVLDLARNFIQLQVDERLDAKGRPTRKEALIFPRYHQYQTVKRLLVDVLEQGSGKNYLIQHSAGSGKSNTIAWTAHRLSELHNAQNEPIFDSVIIITDRRVLDRQLSNTVEGFSQVTGLVQHVESSADLRQALETGARVITSTLQKFPVIVDVMESTAGKRFAVIVDEAHSSTSGESVADLRQVLTLEEAADEQVRAERAFKTTEDQLVTRMQSRKVRSPNLSFFAFTATPKQKTLELFGLEDPMTGQFMPFSTYSMRQAIEEGFILDVLKNYTTFETYFGLLKQVEEDPEFDKKKAQRLLVSYVEKHEHAIHEKTRLMIEHFVEKIQPLIDRKAKAMIVTKSRLHAVRYKRAFDAYLAEKGYSYKALVAFSGVVKDEGKEYTESSMNGVSESQTKECFQKEDHRFLIVAEKYQTGFDQPLLSVMYVDKRLGGVNAVQTLSRLNRTRQGKDEVFVLDFVNETEEIREAFQPYYTTTILSEATDPNIIYDLRRDIENFKVYSTYEVNGFVDEMMMGATPAKLNAILDGVIDRLLAEKAPEAVEQFKSLVLDYLHKYGFISQIVTFKDPYLEKTYIFLKLLIKKIPKREHVLPYEVLDAVDMENYRIQKKAETSIVLESETGVVDAMGVVGGEVTRPVEEKDILSRIIDEVNDRYGTQFSDGDRVILNSLSTRLSQNEILDGSIKSNSKDTAKIKFDELFQQELVDMLNGHFDLYKKLDQNPEMKKYVNERIFEYILRRKNALVN